MNCHQCAYRSAIPGNYHSQCANYTAHVKVSPHGYKQGWVFWPVSFDPIWIESCDSFKPIEKKESAE